MSSAGTIQDMVRRSRQNREALKQRQDKRKRLREMYTSKVSNYKTIHLHETIPQEELALIKNEIRQRMRKEQQKQSLKYAFVFLGAVLIGAAVLWALLYVMSGGYDVQH